MRFVLLFITVLQISRLFYQDQDEDQNFAAQTITKTKTTFLVLEESQDQSVETRSLVGS